MAEIVNLRRARKSKQRTAEVEKAEAARMAHGIAKPIKKLAEARAQKTERELDGKRLDRDQK